MQRFTRWLPVLAVYLIATALMSWPYANHASVASASYEGDARLIIWTLAWDNRAVLSGLPLFDSNIFYPASCSLRYNEHLFGLSLFTLPLYALTGNPVLSHNVLWLLSFVLNCVAMHVMLRRHVDSDVAAIAGALVYTFSFYKMLHAHAHLHLIWTWLLPVSLVLFERWHERPTPGRAAAWVAAALLQALTSWYLAVMTIVTLGVVVAWRHATDVRRGWGPRCRQLAGGVIATALLLWPFAEPYRSLPAAAGSLASFSADWVAYLVPPENTWMGQWWLSRGSAGSGLRWIWGEQTLYLGWIATALGATGLLALTEVKRFRAAGPYLILLPLALWLSLGPSDGWSPFGWFATLPGVGAFRVPARFAWLVLLALAVFVTLGVDFLVRRLRRGLALAVLLIPPMMSEWYVVKFPGGHPQPHAVPPIYRHPALAGARALVSLPDHSRTQEWFRGADYLYYSTVHWRPIANGFGRTEPPSHGNVMSHMRAFPGPNNARTMRRLQIDYVVVHAERIPDGVDIASIASSPEYDLVAQIGSDYLFKVRPAAGPQDIATHEWGWTEPCRFGLASFVWW